MILNKHSVKVLDRKFVSSYANTSSIPAPPDPYSDSYPFPPEQTSELLDWNDYLGPSSNLPAYLNPVTDQMSLFDVVRVSDEFVLGVGDAIEKRHVFSTRQPWNSDKTFIALAGDSRILDGSDFSYLGISNGFGSLGWSPSQPLKVYDTSPTDNYFRIQDFNPSTYEVTTSLNRVFNTSETFTGTGCTQDYINLSHHTDQGNVSVYKPASVYVDKHVALYGQTAATGSDCWVVVYDIELDSVVSETNMNTPISNINWVSMTPDASLVVVQYVDSGVGTRQGTRSYNVNMGREEFITSHALVGDLGIDSDGDPVFVHVNNEPSGFSLSSTKLEGGVSTDLFSFSGLGLDVGVGDNIHISCRNIYRNGYAYVSVYGSEHEAKFENFSVKLSSVAGATAIERWCKHYSSEGISKEFHRPHTVPSPDGEMILFSSDWSVPDEVDKVYSYAFVCAKSLLPIGKKGFGSSVTGGEGGTDYIVTNLNTSGPGSFEEAINASGSRIIRFAVSGNIDYAGSACVIPNGDVTIDGSDAPNGGICIKGAKLVIEGSNTLIKHIRVRPGDVVASNQDALSIRNDSAPINGVLIDHCSFSWGKDENVNIQAFSQSVTNVTIQNCIIGQCLDTGSAYACLVDGSASASVTNVSFYKNLWLHHSSRHVRANQYASNIEMVNNVVYNWIRGMEVTRGCDFDMVNNHFKEGASTIAWTELANDVTPGSGDSDCYISGNTNDSGLPEMNTYLLSRNQVSSVVGTSIAPVAVADAIADVLASSGANLPKRDTLDQSYIDDYINTTGALVSTEGVYPDLTV